MWNNKLDLLTFLSINVSMALKDRTGEGENDVIVCLQEN